MENILKTTFRDHRRMIDVMFNVNVLGMNMNKKETLYTMHMKITV